MHIIEKWGRGIPRVFFDEIRYFVLSVSWRVVKYIRERKLDGLTIEEYQEIDDKLEEWRKALYEEDFEVIRKQKQYIVPTTYLSYFGNMPARTIDNVVVDVLVRLQE